jgi:hypothetical protein
MNVTTIDLIEKHDHKDPVGDAKFGISNGVLA